MKGANTGSCNTTVCCQRSSQSRPKIQYGSTAQIQDLHYDNSVPSTPRRRRLSKARLGDYPNKPWKLFGRARSSSSPHFYLGMERNLNLRLKDSPLSAFRRPHLLDCTARPPEISGLDAEVTSRRTAYLGKYSRFKKAAASATQMRSLTRHTNLPLQSLRDRERGKLWLSD